MLRAFTLSQDQTQNYLIIKICLNIIVNYYIFKTKLSKKIPFNNYYLFLLLFVKIDRFKM